MSAPAFTPGPWAISSLGNVSGSVGRVIPIAKVPLHDIDQEQAANASLIIAAPELYEALVNMVSLAEPHFTDAPQTHALNAALNALAKAAGQ